MVELAGKCAYCKFEHICKIKYHAGYKAHELGIEDVFGNIYMSCSLFEIARGKNLPAYDVAFEPYLTNIVKVKDCPVDCSFSIHCLNRLPEKVRLTADVIESLNKDFKECSFSFSCPCLSKTMIRQNKDRGYF